MALPRQYAIIQVIVWLLCNSDKRPPGVVMDFRHFAQSNRRCSTHNPQPPNINHFLPFSSTSTPANPLNLLLSPLYLFISISKSFYKIHKNLQNVHKMLLIYLQIYGKIIMRHWKFLSHKIFVTQMGVT